MKKHSLKKDEWLNAGKVKILQEILPSRLANGDRVLLFSQFTQVLDILEEVLNTMKIRYLKLTGQTNVVDRQNMVDEFYANEGIGVFLLSTRAGGLGLNLAAANVVIVYDQDFNPHNDRQAEDRAWRIGQSRDVTVIKLLTRDTIDEDIYSLAQTKLALDKQVTEDDNVARAAARADSASGTGANTPTEAFEDEGNEGLVEKRMAKSLLSKLREKAVTYEADNPTLPAVHEENGESPAVEPPSLAAEDSKVADSQVEPDGSGAISTS